MVKRKNQNVYERTPQSHWIATIWSADLIQLAET